MAIVIAIRITGILKEIFPLQLYEFCGKLKEFSTNLMNTFRSRTSH